MIELDDLAAARPSPRAYSKKLAIGGGPMMMTTKSAPPPAAALSAPNAAVKKVRGRPFVKGRSGNPTGMKPGTRRRATLWIESMSEGDREAIVAKVLKLARAGDRAALR